MTNLKHLHVQEFKYEHCGKTYLPKALQIQWGPVEIAVSSSQRKGTIFKFMWKHKRLCDSHGRPGSAGFSFFPCTV